MSNVGQDAQSEGGSQKVHSESTDQSIGPISQKPHQKVQQVKTSESEGQMKYENFQCLG